MTQLHEILDIDQLSAEVAAGMVSRRTHPDFPELEIYNYTDQCAFARHWNDVTRITRGLIVNSSTGEVLARPFAKFFNLGEAEAPTIDPMATFYHWQDKADGSLGILYVDPNGYPRIATRGSFASEQAALGTKLLHESGEAWMWAEYIDSGYTPLFEITGPDNRIVVNYEKNALARLGYVSIDDGRYVAPYRNTPMTLPEVLRLPERKNAEGWVLWQNQYTAVKFKYPEYVELHRMVSNLTPKEVWRQMRAGTFQKYVEQLPDELQELAEGWFAEIEKEYISIVVSASHSLHALQSVPGLESRKDQAIWIQKNVDASLRGLVFSLLDHRSISEQVYKMIEPKG